MAQAQKLNFRIPKEERVKIIARRPKGFLRPTQVHKVRKRYDRRRARAELHRILGSNDV
jgi:hypothetical protein